MQYFITSPVGVIVKLQWIFKMCKKFYFTIVYIFGVSSIYLFLLKEINTFIQQELLEWH